MDWSKAKTILIVAFTITNIFLAIVLFNGNKNKEVAQSKELITKTIELLNKKNIQIDTEIPLEHKNLSGIQVEFENLDSTKINNSFFDGKGNFKVGEDGVIIIENEYEQVRIRSSWVLEYKNSNETVKYKDLDLEKARLIGEEFLEERSLSREDMELIFEEDMGDHYFFSYTKKYEGVDLEKSYMNIKVDKRGVKSLERLWLNVKGQGRGDIYVNSATKALLSLITDSNYYNKTIVDISLVYYFEPEVDPFIDAPSRAKGGRTVSGWRILFSDGTKAIVGNY